MRKIISWEGEEKVSGMIIEKGASTWGDEPLPITWNFDFATAVLGYATRLRREINGGITAKIEFNDLPMAAAHAKELVKGGEASLAMWGNEVKREVVDDVQHIHAVHIRAVGVVPRNNAAW